VSKYWLTPPELHAQLDLEFGFSKYNFDPCPYPFAGYNGADPNFAWAPVTYCNPPFRKKDALYGAGPAAFIRKALAERQNGRTTLLVLNTSAYLNELINAKVEMRALGRVRWRECTTGEPMPSPACTSLFIFRP
jgi:hypothetical protein